MALLPGDTGLQLHEREVGHLALDGHTGHLGPLAVAALLHLGIVGLVEPDLLEHKHMVEPGVEPLEQQVALEGSEAAVHVGREAHAVRLLLLQVGRLLDDSPLAPYGSHVQVLVVGLRSPETRRIAGPQVDVGRGVETHIGPGTEDNVIDKVVLVEPSAHEETPAVVLPLVLQEGTLDMHLLAGGAVVALHLVAQLVVVILDTGSQVGRHEETAVETVDILSTGYHRQVAGLAIGIEVLLRAVIAVAVDMLGRGVEIDTVFLVGSKEAVAESSPVDRVVQLLGNIGLVGRTVQQVTAPPILVDVVILQRELGVVAGLQVRAESQRLPLQLG